MPSEPQWEYACRAGTTTRFNLGNSESDLGRAGWFSGNAGGRTQAVEQMEANAWGLYDMHGNVEEWTRTWFGIYPGGSVEDYESLGSGRMIQGDNWISAAPPAASTPPRSASVLLASASSLRHRPKVLRRMRS